MQIRASASFRAGDVERTFAAISSRVEAAVANGANAVLDISRQIVPVRTGDLASSGGVDMERKKLSVVAAVSYTSGHAAYVEFGTGRRGAESGNAAPGIEYDPNWPGMTGTPYIRPALDSGRPDIMAAFDAEGFKFR